MPQAKITIRSNETGLEVVAESNGDGLVPHAESDSRVVLAERHEARLQDRNVRPGGAEVNQTVRVDFKLAVGSVTDSVEVHATAMQLLSTESAEISQVIASKQVSEIPLNGRQWQQLIALSAGVNPGAPGKPVRRIRQYERPAHQSQSVPVDGISTTSSAQGRGDNFNIPLDAVQEFSVQAGGYSAEFGNVAGGVINLQSKSGTNNWHGSLFEFFRNDKMDAANFFPTPLASPRIRCATTSSADRWAVPSGTRRRSSSPTTRARSRAVRPRW